MKYSLFKVKEGKLQVWKDWCKLLSTEFKDEALKTIKEENLLLEGCLVFPVGKDFYVVGYTLENAGGVKPTNLDNNLNKKHLEKRKECLEFVCRGESEYFLNL
ncbi:MAG: DUF6176 family protein [Patescibacteria group bacterium]